MSGSKMSKKVRLFFSSSNQLAFGLKMAHKVKALRERLDEIAALRKFHLDERRVERSVLSRETHSSPPQVVIGREHDKEKIVEGLLLLSSHDDQENVSVVSILGIGGLGKTTLAQMVFDDDTVKNHFELKMWVCVSLDFDVQKLVEKVLESATRHPTQNTQFDAVKNQLHEKIKGKRYLLVLDDVWNKDKSKWSDLIDLLAGGARGSKIVVTTRIRETAEMSEPIYKHELEGLSEEEAWSLFQKMAFKTGQVLNQRHEDMGRQIVAKCRGVPLAIRAIGGMLYSKDLETEWPLFKDKQLLKMDENDSILPILKLSYNHLPSHYKHCFAYCSLYPEDFIISVEQLICLWKAQGYLKSTDQDECLQEVGYGWFMDLYRLSFFQDVTKDEFGKIESCKMHDLMHDLAISIAGNNFSSSLTEIRRIKGKTQHMSFLGDRDSTLQDFSPLLKAKKTRTVLSLPPYAKVIMKEKEVDDVFCNLRCLRVLSLSTLQISKLPCSIYKLKHLRHLDLSFRDIEKLPDSITNLLNLQVLKLSRCKSLKQLPNNITKLVNLTELDNGECKRLTHMPLGIGKLTRLEKLPLFVMGKDDSTSKNSGGLDELHALNNLRGSLEIKNLKYVKNAEFEFKAAKLSEKKQLQELTLRWNEERDDGNNNCSADDEMGLEALRPHQSLKTLCVSYYKGVRPPSWLPSITNLVSFTIAYCRSIKWLPPLDQLPHLKKLRVEDLTKLEHIDVENRTSSSVFFPSLEQLIIVRCPNLKGFGFERSNKSSTDFGSTLSMEDLPTCFPRLSQLTILGCTSLTCILLSPELKTLKLDGDGVKSLMGTTGSASSESTTSSPFSNLSQLEDLRIVYMEDCQVDELVQHLPSLQKLEFYYSKCKSVSSDEEEDDAMQWKRLKVIRSVVFNRMENLVCLPKGLQYVTTLKCLSITFCNSLASVPEWMGNLTALQDLIIHECPKLSERCNNNTAEDWLHISHIPNIQIDDQIIQRNSCYLL